MSNKNKIPNMPYRKILAIIVFTIGLGVASGVLFENVVRADDFAPVSRVALATGEQGKQIGAGVVQHSSASASAATLIKLQTEYITSLEKLVELQQQEITLLK